MQTTRRLSSTVLAVVLYVFSNQVMGQTSISGVVSYNNVNPLANVNISIEGSYDGATSDQDGKFSFETDVSGPQTLIAKVNGFTDVVQIIEIKQGVSLTLPVIFVMKTATLNEVIVKAKSFEGGDRYKVTILNTTDILTTATDANITTALKTLPGAQQVGESSDLFVRGGAGYETKTFIDGLPVSNFNYSSPSNMASRSRFPAGMFKGTFFSSGGYSAQYGQALSGALILESQDIPARSSAEISLSPIMNGGRIEKVTKDKKTVYGGTVNYTNLTPYFSIAKPAVPFNRNPVYLDGNLYFRKQLFKTGMLKFYGSYGYNRLSLQKPDMDYEQVENRVGLQNKNLYTNLTYRQSFDKGWKWYIGTSYSTNLDQVSLRVFQDTTLWYRDYQLNRSSVLQAKTVITKNIFTNSQLHWGGEHQVVKENWQREQSTHQGLTDQYSALFLEADAYLTSRLVARIGGRWEYASVLKRGTLSPRLTLGYTFDNSGLLSFSYGQFYQKPEKEYLFYHRNLTFTNAKHYILSYQKMDNYRTFRTELFYKKYDNLVKTTPDTTNSGDGYASGLELFWRDKKTIKGIDYWLSYSLLDTKRNYLNYPHLVQPGFAATHTFSSVVKRYFPKLSTNISATYTFATGRPYYNPNRDSHAFMTDRTINYHNLGLSIAYLPKIKKTFSVIVLTVSNVLGNQQIYGYTYSSKDFQRREAIVPTSNPFVFLGFFLNFGVDRTDDIINSRL